MYTDWNCELLSCVRIDQENGFEEFSNAVAYLTSNFQITKFCMLPFWNPLTTPLSHFLIKRQTYLQRLLPLVERDVEVKIAAKILLTKGISLVDGLEEMTAATGGYLPIALPMAEYQDWMDYELNRLLYRRKCKLMLTCCEQISALYPTEIVTKLFRMENALYQFQYKALEDPASLQLIHRLFLEDRYIVFGSGVNSLQKAWHFHFLSYQKYAQTQFSAMELSYLHHNASRLW